MRTSFIAIFLFILSALVVRATEIEFAGYAMFADGPIFSIHNSAKKEFSPWIKIGQEWAGHRIIAFDKESESLILLKGDSRLVLILRSAKIGEEAYKLPNMIKGSFTLLDGTVIYSEDAIVRLGAASIGSSGGVMVSDKAQNQIVGDLKIGNATFENARATEIDGAVIVTSEKVIIKNTE